MKNPSLIFNVILAVAVAVLFYLHFSSRSGVNVASKTTTSKDTTNSDFRMAYFEMDSLTNSFSMVKDVTNELSKEEDKMNNELTRMQKTYNDRISQYQRQAETMSQVESEKANRDVLQLQESMRNKKQEMDQRYQDLLMRKKQEIKNKIEDYLKEYNKTKGYSYIVSYEPGLIFYRDTGFNITKDLVQGLNEQYKKKN